MNFYNIISYIVKPLHKTPFQRQFFIYFCTILVFCINYCKSIKISQVFSVIKLRRICRLERFIQISVVYFINITDIKILIIFKSNIYIRISFNGLFADSFNLEKEFGFFSIADVRNRRNPSCNFTLKRSHPDKLICIMNTKVRIEKPQVKNNNP